VEKRHRPADRGGERRRRLAALHRAGRAARRGQGAARVRPPLQLPLPLAGRLVAAARHRRVRAGRDPQLPGVRGDLPGEPPAQHLAHGEGGHGGGPVRAALRLGNPGRPRRPARPGGVGAPGGAAFAPRRPRSPWGGRSTRPAATSSRRRSRTGPSCSPCSAPSATPR
jgi:hypothetical protein